ncbi:MAG: Nucleoid occlusion protein [Syntrophus sp. SKADARSKE-3]|nr:Nucleoid occlusion protein [Syntrophus sp. SKADARSKE-3]
MKLENIKVALAYESATNPRGKDFEGPAFNDLVASVKEKGVLVPVIARPKKKGDKQFEIVAGNRRFRAAKLAGLEEIPARVEEMTDEQAREIQIIENLQREDVHPIEEGQAYRQLVEKSKYSIAEIAQRVGKSESYVRYRLFLTNLIDKAAIAFREGKITDGHAVLIAKLSPNDQTAAMKYINDGWQIPTVKDLKEWIERNIYSLLDNQPWLKSEEAMKATGKCKECEPNRASLFGEVKEGACTDLKCWARKMDNFINWRVAEGKLAKVSGDYSTAPKGVMSRSDYVLVAKKGKDRCESARGAIIISGSDIGKEIDICSNPKCKTHKGEQTSYSLTPKEIEKRKAERKAEAKKAKKAKEARKNRLEKALENVKWPFTETHLKALLALAFDQASANAYRSIAKRRELEVKKVKNSWGSGTTIDYSGAVKSVAKDMDKTEQARLAFELLIDSGYDSLRSGVGKLIEKGV